MKNKQKKLLYFGPTRLDAILKKGNVWYVRHYERYFDKVYVIYLMGNKPGVLRQGRTVLVSLGSGNKIINLLLAPWRLFRISERLRPTNYLTADQVFLWWTAWMVRLLKSVKIILMPVCMPEVIYRSSGKAHTGLPISLERLFISFSFTCAHRILTGRSFGSFCEWLSHYPPSKDKLISLDLLVESLPSAGFYGSLRKSGGADGRLPAAGSRIELIYVGRLHREKLVDDLVRMMAAIQGEDPGAAGRIFLNLIGDGPELDRLKELARELQVEDRINFLGPVANEKLPEYLGQANIFVSTLTGTSLREAALCGLPIVAYDLDWISGLLKQDETALLAPPGDYAELGRQVLRLAQDRSLYARLAQNVGKLAWEYWSPERCQESLALAFADH